MINSRKRHSTLRFIPSIALATVLAFSADAYQQGSLFLFDVQKDENTAAIAGRIPIKPTFFSKTGIPNEPSQTLVTERSEFEIEYNVLSTGSSSSFSGGLNLNDFSTGSNSTTESSFGLDSESNERSGLNF